MPPVARFLILRLLFVPLTLVVVTAALMAIFSFVPPEVRAVPYLPRRLQQEAEYMDNEWLRSVSERYIRDHHLDDPFPVQYAYWVAGLIQEKGFYSPSLGDSVFDAFMERTPVTAELTLLSLLLFIPLGVLAGLYAGWRPGGRLDVAFRAAAYTAASVPPFILALLLLGVFYVSLEWFPPGRLSVELTQVVRSAEFTRYTGMLTIDSLLNRRPDIFVDALRHLVLPVITLSLVHWATLGRIVRSSTLGERRKDYVTAARAHGIHEGRLVRHHVLRNVLAPALSSSALAAASLFTGVFMIEIIFELKGVSDLIVGGAIRGLDVPIAMGFTVYSVCAVLVVMFVLDVLRALVDPRSREGLIHAGSDD